MNKMLIPVKWLTPNPFRDFERYPIDEEQVATLLASIDGLSFWGGVTARKVAPEVFQIGGGHHRVEAYKRARAKNPALPAQIEVCVDGYTDLQMAQIQAIENMTQRGNRAAAALDSIGGLYEVFAYAILKGDEVAAIAPTLGSNRSELENLRTALADGRGLGALTFLDALPIGCMSKDTVQIALRTLKDGGLDAPIMARVHTRIEAETAERVAEEHRKAEEAEQARIVAEKARKAAEAKAEQEAKERAEREERRHRVELDRQAKLVADAERKAAEKAERERQTEEKHLERERRAAEKAELKRLKDEAEATAKAEKQAKADEEQQRQPLVAATKAHEAAENREKTLDPRVSAQFGWSNWQIREWNRAVSSKTAQHYLPREQHFALAKAINAKADELAQESDEFQMTGKWIATQVESAVEQALGIQRDITKREKMDALRESAQKRVYEQFKIMRNACASLFTASRKLADLKREYAEKKLGAFPYDGDTWRILRETRQAIDLILSTEK